MRHIHILKTVRAAVFAWPLGVLACGDSPTAPSSESSATVSIDGPDTYAFGALGYTVQLTARATAADGSTTAPSWRSSLITVAEVTGSGLVSVVGNGTAVIIASAGSARDSVSLVVDQVPVSMHFSQGPGGGAMGIPFILPITVDVVDSSGFLVESALDPVTLSLANNPSAAALNGTLARTPIQGRATFDDLSVDAPGMGYTLEAAAMYGTATSAGFDIVAAPDLVRFHNTADWEVGALLDGSAGFFVDDLGHLTTDSMITTVLWESSRSNEIIAFTRGRPPAVLTPASWSDGIDTLDVTFRDPIRISVTAWIVAGTFDALRNRALSQAATTAAVWDAERMGVEFEEFEIIDATSDPDAVNLLRTTMCQQQGQAESQIGKTSGRINVYYVETVDNSHNRAYSCGNVIFMADQSGHELLVHEIGHSFGLGHVDNLPEYGLTNVMHSASTVLIFSPGRLPPSRRAIAGARSANRTAASANRADTAVRGGRSASPSRMTK